MPRRKAEPQRDFTYKELQIAQMLANGYDQSEISIRFNRSYDTTRMHTRSLRAKAAYRMRMSETTLTGAVVHLVRSRLVE